MHVALRPVHRDQSTHPRDKPRHHLKPATIRRFLHDLLASRLSHSDFSPIGTAANAAVSLLRARSIFIFLKSIDRLRGAPLSDPICSLRVVADDLANGVELRVIDPAVSCSARAQRVQRLIAVPRDHRPRFSIGFRNRRICASLIGFSTIVTPASEAGEGRSKEPESMITGTPLLRSCPIKPE